MRPYRTAGLAAGMGLAICVQASGAEVKQPTSVFEKPSYGSRQVDILPAEGKITVTGHEEKRDGVRWVPVRTKAGAGWIPADSIELSREDMGYVTWPGKEHSWWTWGAVGVAGMSSTDFYYGARAAFGMDWFVNHHRQFFAGFAVTSPFTREKLPVLHNGKSQRYNTYGTFGYLLLPPKVFARFGLGLSVLAGANRSFANKFGASAMAELGYHFRVTEDTRWTLSFSYEYTGKSRQSVNFLQDLGHCVFGGCDPSYATPPASIFAANLSFAFAP